MILCEYNVIIGQSKEIYWQVVLFGYFIFFSNLVTPSLHLKFCRYRERGFAVSRIPGRAQVRTGLTGWFDSYTAYKQYRRFYILLCYATTYLFNKRSDFKICFSSINLSFAYLYKILEINVWYGRPSSWAFLLMESRV